jgi:flagellar FliL protein
MSDDKADSVDGEGDDEAGAKKKKGGSKMLPLLLLVNTLLIGAVLFFLIKRPAAAPAVRHGDDQAEDGDGDEKDHGKGGDHEGGEGKDEGKKAALAFKAPGPILKLENFVIQLKTVDQDRYVRLAFDVEVQTEDDKNAITAHMSHIRDLVIAFFADRTLDELRGSEAMERTKATLIKKIDEIVPGKRIKNLFITDFIVQ